METIKTATQQNIDDMLLRIIAQRTDVEKKQKNFTSIPETSASLEISRIIKLTDQYRKRNTPAKTKSMPNLIDPQIEQAHLKFIIEIANSLLSHEGKQFNIDNYNVDVVLYLLHYFNNSPKAEKIFPGKNYQNHKNILIYGEPGTGKSLLMQIFAKYLDLTDNPNKFINVSVTQMVNYYAQHNNLDRFTYNEESGKGFHSMPYNLCLNDIGIESKVFYGMDTKLLTDEFLYARNEIWTMYHQKAHLTTNLTPSELSTEIRDSYGRLADRFKTYNIIHLGGNSRR